MSSILKVRDENGNFIDIPAIKGDDGKSAYELAVEGGYKGSEEDFITTLNASLSGVEVSHLTNKDNPHEVTAEQTGALSLDGGTLKGTLGFSNGYGRVGADTNHANITAYNGADDTDNRRSILVCNSNFSGELKEAIRVRSVVDGVQRDYKIYGEHNKPTAADVGALPLSGGALTDTLVIEAGEYNYSTDKDGDEGIVIQRGDGGKTSINVDGDGYLVISHSGFSKYDGKCDHQLILGEMEPQYNDTGTPVGRSSGLYLTDGNYSTSYGGKQSVFHIFGEHNKPSGTYIGNGEDREIDTYGIGSAALVYGAGGDDAAIVTPLGAFSQSGSGTLFYEGCKFVNGKLILEDEHYVINRSGRQYSYQVL